MTDLRQSQLAALTGRPALVVVDVQKSFVFEGAEATVDVIARLVDSARDNGVPVVWVGLGSDPDRPWKASAWLRQGDPDAPYGPDEPCVLGTPGAEWHTVSPAPGEITVVKRAYSGFLGTSLELLLRQEGIGWLAICGLTTECCVAATATDACQLEWPVLIPRDGTAAYEQSLHEAALTQLALNVAVLTDADELAGIWKGAAA